MIKNGSKKVRILIADDDRNVSHALSILIHERCAWKLTGIIRKAEDFYHELSTNKPDIILVDLKLPGLEITRLIEMTRSMDPPPFVIVLCQDDEKEDISVGVGCTISKFDPPERLIAALRASQEKFLQIG